MIQRLRSAGNLNIHLRCLSLNGPARLSHTRLLERVFDFDPARRPNCDRALKIIAAILDQPVIANILAHLDLRARASDCFEAKSSWWSVSLVGRLHSVAIGCFREAQLQGLLLGDEPGKSAGMARPRLCENPLTG